MKRNKELGEPQADQLGGAEKIELYKELYKNPTKVIEDPKLLDWFYLLFDKPIIHTINGQKDNSVVYIWFIPPVIAAVTDGHFRYLYKSKKMYYDYNNRKYPCNRIEITKDQALKLSKTDESMIGVQSRAQR